MTDQQIKAMVDSALVEEFELDPEALSPEANLYADLGLDSLDAVDMVIVLENAFRFKIREEQSLRAIRTLGDLYAFIILKHKELQVPV